MTFHLPDEAIAAIRNRHVRRYSPYSQDGKIVHGNGLIAAILDVGNLLTELDMKDKEIAEKDKQIEELHKVIFHI